MGNFFLQLQAISKKTGLDHDGERSSCRKWQSSYIRKESVRLKSQCIANHNDLALSLFKAGHSTLHHKISRHVLDLAYLSWKKADKPTGYFSTAIAICEHITDKKGLNALKNAPFNIELGPIVDIRTGDPGDKFDPNFSDDGSMTPRSKALRKANTDKEINYEAVGEAFINAYLIHIADMKLLGSEMSEPNLKQWQLLDDGRWRRLGC